MKVIDASYKIIEPELQAMTIYERLETCGRICYKSENKITKDSALPFCKMMFENKHMSTMEMARLHFIVMYPSFSSTNELKKFKYLDVTQHPVYTYISGSVRGFYEALDSYRNEVFVNPYMVAISRVLNKEYSELFSEVIPDHRIQSGVSHIIDKGYRIQEDYEVLYEHQYIAVRFIVNRAVTHEIVRHRPVTYLQESQRYCRYSDDKFGNEVTFINPKPFFVKGVEASYDIWKDSCERAEKDYLELLRLGNSPQAARTVLPNSCKTEIIVYTDTTEWEHIFKLRTSKAAEPSMREVMIPLEIEMRERGYLKAK